ncbi:MAG: LPS export ABC transporter permease LptF [Aquamicrobium sp.]|uniref:LPS export ABC transporter permease LptF n=1 Tax=Aquamicrobium sp. TaxID=1872579 RepID=UPI00349E9586|nr:LPS export ABC transporter permease LptF [Aquamicrobium sp.]
MKIIERYILKRATGIFMATLLWVLAIVWTTQVLLRIDIVTSNGQSIATFLEIALLILPSVIPVVIPFAVGIAVAQTLSTMNTDSELIVISAAGSPRMTVIRPMLKLAVVASLVCLVIATVLNPTARQRMRVLLAESRADLITSVVDEGTFQKVEDGLYIQIGKRLPDGRLGGIFVADGREDGTELLYYAKEGATVEMDGNQLLVMQDGTVHRKTNGNISIVRYSSYAFDLSQFAPSNANTSLRPKERDTAYLFSPAANDSHYQRNPQVYRAEIHRRFSEWLYPMVFALIGLAVAGDSRSFREARIHPLLSTMAIALVFRWAGFYLTDKLESSAAYTLAVYLVPLSACAIAAFFIATNRVMELPMWMVEKIANLWNRIAAEATGFWRRLTGSGPSASGGRA